MNWWCGYTLLIAVGTLTYITLMHILREVYLEGGHDEDCHFKGEANDANASYHDDEKQSKAPLLDSEKHEHDENLDHDHNHN